MFLMRRANLHVNIFQGADDSRDIKATDVTRLSLKDNSVLLLKEP